MDRGRIGPLTRERRRELTRTALIEAAADLFARRGFHGTSLEEIASAAGFTRGAIYKNFGSKEEILIAVIEWLIERQLAAYADALEEAQASEADRVAAAAEVWARAFRRDAGLALLELELRLHALRDPRFRPRLAEWNREQARRIARFIEEHARGAGLRPGVPAEDLAVLALAGVEGLTYAAAIDSEHASRYDGLVELFFRLVSDALLPPASPGRARAARARGRPGR